MTDTAANEGRASRGGVENRVDPAHRLGAAPAEATRRTIPAEALAAAMAGGYGLGEPNGPSLLADEDEATDNTAWSEAGVALVSQMREQATQLARHLQSQQQHLDRREAELHAREAAMESEMRAARVWLVSRQDELAEQAAVLEQQQAAAAARQKAGEIVEAETVGVEAEQATPTLRLHIADEAPGGAKNRAEQRELENRVRALDARQQELERRETKLADSQQQLEHRALELAKVERDQQTIAEDIQRRETLLAQRQGKLDAQKTELETRHRQLDERQAQLYRDIEEHTQQRTRQAGDLHALEELRAEIAARRVEFDQQRLAIEHQRAEVAAQLELQASFDRDLAEREQALALRQQEIETAIKRFERLGIIEQRGAELEELARQFQERAKFLDDAEQLLEQQQQELQALRERCEAERAEQESVAERQRLKWMEEQKRAAADIARRRESLQRRAEHLDTREAAFEQLRAEVNREQRETLETRLATEELWAQMSGPLAPASLARSLAQVRAKLAEHYRLTDRELATRREELESLRRSLDEKHTQLQQRRHELEDWAERQRHEIEDHAARLVGREQELDRQQAYFEELESRWEEERHSYRQDIRLLLGKLRACSPSESAAVA